MQMTEEMFRVVLETAGAKADKDGWASLPDHHMMTLYVGHNGVQLTVSKVTAVKTVGPICKARNLKGELFVLAIDDIFATALDGGGEAIPVRKAGFLG